MLPSISYAPVASISSDTQEWQNEHSAFKPTGRDKTASLTVLADFIFHFQAVGFSQQEIHEDSFD
jgi:hypothetical protein